MLLFVATAEGLSNHTRIAKQVGVDAEEFDFGDPAEVGGEVEGDIDADALVAAEEGQGGVVAVGLFHGFWRAIATETTEVEAAIHL